MFGRITVTNSHRNDAPRAAAVQTAVMLGNMDEQTRKNKLNEAYKIGRDLGRKFEVTDITNALVVAAEIFTYQYNGTFEYMQSMSDALARWGHLTDKQAAGVLNCLMAEARKRIADRQALRQAAEQVRPAATVAVESTVAPVRDGFYTVRFEDGTHRTYRVQTLNEQEIAKQREYRLILSPNAQHVSLLIGADNTSDYARMGIMDAGQMVKTWRTVKTYQGREATGEQLSRAAEGVRVLFGADAEHRTAFGLAYAMASGNCWVCGRVLTTPESVAAGIGPVCSGRE